MKITHSFVAASIFMLLSSATWAIDSDAHSTHHSDATVSASKSTKVDTNSSAKSELKMHSSMAQESIEKMDDQMKIMNDMHQKMMNAKTPDERKVLMVDHMKAMQGGMTMMGNMPKETTMKMDAKGDMHDGMKCDMNCDMATHHKIMEKRMQMMETMMQMMMDRMTP